MYTERIFDFAAKHAEGMYRITVTENGASRSLEIAPSNQTNDCYSVSKLFTATAVGFLYDEGKISLDERIVDIFREELPAGADPRLSLVTVDMVLRHAWGIAKGFLDIDQEDVAAYETLYGTGSDFLKIALSARLPLIPGTTAVYSDAAYYLLSRIVTQKAGVELYDYLRERLFNPLRFAEAAWSKCPLGYSLGATGLFIRTGDMAKLGQLYLDHGLFQGARILSPQWCGLATERGYSLDRCNPGCYSKGGLYGQLLYIDFPHRLAVAWTGYDVTGYTKRMTALLDEIALQ